MVRRSRKGYGPTQLKRPLRDGSDMTALPLPFGCGEFAAARRLNTDLRSGTGFDVVAEIRHGLPFCSGSFPYIASTHAPVELRYFAIVPALCELLRVVRADGGLRLGLPELNRARQAHRSDNASYFSIPDDETALIDAKLIVQPTWYGTNTMMFTAASARDLLERAGSRRVATSTFGRTASTFAEIIELDNRPCGSFFAEAWK